MNCKQEERKYIMFSKLLLFCHARLHDRSGSLNVLKFQEVLKYDVK